MTPSVRRRPLAFQVLYYLAILVAILLIASLRIAARPSFVYQGF